MNSKILFCLFLLIACQNRKTTKRVAAVAAVPGVAAAGATGKTGFSRFQLTGPEYIQADSIPFGSDTIFSTSVRCISDTPLVIFKTEGSCICTTMNLATPTTLKKGESIRLPIRYNTRLKGPFSQSVLVFNNTEINPLVISIKGVIK
jgi:hypothetical protein